MAGPPSALWMVVDAGLGDEWADEVKRREQIAEEVAALILMIFFVLGHEDLPLSSSNPACSQYGMLKFKPPEPSRVIRPSLYLLELAIVPVVSCSGSLAAAGNAFGVSIYDVHRGCRHMVDG